MPEPASMKISFASQDGAEESVTSVQLMEDLAEAGYSPLGVSPDGMVITMRDEQGSYDTPVGEIMQNLGYSVKAMMPESMGTEHIDPSLRFAVENLSDEEDKKVFLQAKIDRMYGENAPKVNGQGSDWYYFDPASGGYQALTNTPGLDKSDIGEFGAMIPKLAAETLGFAAAGPGGAAAANIAANATLKTIAGTKEGSGWDQFGQALAMGSPGSEFMSEEIDKNFKENLDPDFPMNDTGGDILKEGAMAGVFGGAVKAGGALMPKAASFMKSGPVSRAGQGVSEVVEGVGGMTKGGIDMVKSSPIAEDLLINYNPMINPLANPAMAMSLLRAPRGGITMAAEGVGKLGKSERFAKMFGDDIAGKFRNFSEEVSRPRGAGGGDLMASDVLGNLGEMGARSSIYGPPTAFRAAMAESLPKVGESAGKFIHGVGALGKSGEDLLRGASSKATSMIGAGGQVLGAAGRAGKAGFGMTRGIEPHATYGAAKGAAEGMGYGYPDLRSEEEIIFDRWRKRRRQDTMGTDFVQN